jgi:hypothetical protein
MAGETVLNEFTDEARREMEQDHLVTNRGFRPATAAVDCTVCESARLIGDGVFG